MGNTINSANQQNISVSQKNNHVAYVLDTQKPLCNAKKPAAQLTPLHQPKKMSFFRSHYTTSAEIASSEVNRIIAGMQRRG